MTNIVRYGGEENPESVGMNGASLKALAGLLEEQAAKGWHKGAQFVVLWKGKALLDQAIGEDQRGRPINVDTPFYTFSVAKAFTAVCVHKLIEAGRIDLGAPVAEYWPEFGKRGKETATIRHVFLHQAGVPMRGLYTQIPTWPFWRVTARKVANLKAEYEPGSQTMYHLVNYGFILGEVVRRVSGMRIEAYLHKHFIEPLGLKNTWMQIPKEELKRSPRMAPLDKEQDKVTWLFNLAVIRRAVIPAASLHSTARDLAVFYQMLVNGGEYDGKRFLQPETIATATKLSSEMPDGFLGRTTRWGLGFHLGGMQPPPGEVGPSMGWGSTVRTFGHFGNASSMAWADPDRELVVTFTCDGLLSQREGRKRWVELSDAVWDCFSE